MVFGHLCLEHFRFISKRFALFCGGHLSVAMLLLPIILVEVPLPRPLLRAVAKGYRRHAFTPCVTGCPRSARKTTHRHGLASGMSPTVRYQSKPHWQQPPSSSSASHRHQHVAARINTAATLPLLRVANPFRKRWQQRWRKQGA